MSDRVLRPVYHVRQAAERGEVVHHGALLGACYMVDLLQDTEQPAKLRLDVAAQLYDRAYGRPPIAGALLDAGGAAVHVVADGMTDDEAREQME